MPNSSKNYLSFRLEWHPSRACLILLLLLSVAAVYCVFASRLPSGWKLCLSAGAMGWGCFQASTYWQSLPLVLACHRDQASLIINRSTAASVIDLQVIERGILVGVIMTLASGQKHRVLWWFDQLNPIQRQRLFLLNRVFTRD